MAIQPTINAVWAENTNNKTKFLEDEVKLGIIYKGPVVSNQLNGLGYSLYKMLDFEQRGCGYFNINKTYYNNDIVMIARKSNNSALKIEFYRCKTSGIKGHPPIINASIDDTYYVNIYTNGVIDGINWERLDDANSVSLERDNAGQTPFLTSHKIQFLTPIAINQLEQNQATIGGDLKFSVYFKGQITTFDVKVKQKYVKNSQGGINVFNNHFNMEAPELEISNVFSTIKDFGELNNYYNLMPYGMRFEIGKLNGKFYVFIQVRESIEKIIVEGHCEGFNISLSNEIESDSIETKLIIPIKENGGALCYDKLGSMIDFDYEPSPEQAYKKGLYVLNNTAIKELESDLFSMLFLEQGHTTIPAMLGRFRRNEGIIRDNASSLTFRTNQESGVPNITGSAWNGYRGILGNFLGACSAYGTKMIDWGSTGGATVFTGFNFNAKASSNKYKDNFDEVVPDNVAVRMCYVAF